MTELMKIINKRHSCRNFDGVGIPEEKILQCIEAAGLAPSACNNQPWHFIMVTEPTRVQQVSKCMQEIGANNFTSSAGAFVIVTEDKPKVPFVKLGNAITSQKFKAVDIGIATAHFVLQATELDINTCILGWFNERKLKILLSVPKDIRIRLAIAMGHEIESLTKPERVRKSLEEIVGKERY